MNPESPDTKGRGTHRAKSQAASTSANASRRLSFPAPALILTILFLAFALLPRVQANPKLVWAFLGVGTILLVWVFALWARAKQRGRDFPIEFVPVIKSHYVQACVHTSIYAYWGWYWRPVYSEAPLILAQIVFLYVLDALLSWSRGRSWRPGFGPFPIIFSTNLFIWFKDDWYFLQFVMVAIGAFGKEFIRWQRDGRSAHIFNPSAVGLALFSIVLIATGTTHITWGVEIATTLGLPPHIYLEIFLLGLVVQYFFAVTLMTLSAAGVLYLLDQLYFAATGTYHFIDTGIPIAVFLGLHLLVTDPATSPRSNPGRVIFGALYGLGNFVLYWVFFRLNVPEFYDKLLPVPVLNLTVRVIDRFTAHGVFGRFSQWEKTFRPRKLNLAYMGCWAALFLWMLATDYVDAPHPGASLAFWKKAHAEGKPDAGIKLLKLTQSQASQGSVSAANDLGVIYMRGELIQRDRAAAGHYFATACEAANVEGCANLASQFLFLREARSDRDVARALGVLEYECGRASDGRNCHLIGLAYETGMGRVMDKARAREFYGQGCERGNVEACKGLARIQFSGSGVPADLRKAAQLLEGVCAAGDAESCLYLAYLHQGGSEVPGDPQKAQAFLEQACTLGSQQACRALKQTALPPFSSLLSMSEATAGSPNQVEWQ